MAIVNFGPFQLGPNTFWLDLHGMMMFIILVFSAFLFGAIFFAKTADAVLVRRLKISASVSFAALLLLIVSGIIPDIGFTAAALNGTTHNAYGTFTTHVTDTSLGNFTGPVLFDMMEHVSLIVPGIAAVVGVLIFAYGSEVITVQSVRRTVLTLMVLAGVWTIVIGGIGVYLTKVLTYPLGS